VLILMIIKSYNIYINYYYYTYPSVDLPPPKKIKKKSCVSRTFPNEDIEYGGQPSKLDIHCRSTKVLCINFAN